MARTFALYRISQANGGRGGDKSATFIQDGRQINRGLEVSFAGDLVRGLHAILSASFLTPSGTSRRTHCWGKSASVIQGATERVCQAGTFLRSNA